ncbi:MAG: PAS domain S-box protein [Nitrospinae bacterium]|nr:PAS domain S-box protein [Nitrospinota bacterium]
MSAPMSIHERTERSAGYAFILIFALMAMGIVLIGYLHYLNYERNYRANVESELSSIVKLKVDELELWRRERLGDGAVLFRNAAFSALVRRFLEQPGDVNAQRRLQAWMGKYLTAYQYAWVTLFDTQGRIRMTAPQTPAPVELSVTRDITEILRSGKVGIEDFHRYAPDLPIHLAVVVPVIDESDGGRPLGVLALRIDPATYLYSFIGKWPTPSQTAETLLIRRDGDDALFLNNLRFQKNTALNLRIPLTKTEVPAVRAALGQTGIFEGVDYRGAPVIAAVRAVPGSPWYLVARMDKSEVYAPVRERLWQMVAFVGALLFGSGSAMGFVWRRKSARHHEREKVAEAERQRLDELSELYQLSNAVSGADTLEDVYEAAKSSILRALKADRVSILLFDSEGVMRFKSWQGLSETYRKAADGHSPWTQDAVNPAPILIDDIELDADWAHFRPVAAAEGIRGFAFIPLARRNRPIGKFMVYFNKPHHFTGSEIKLAETIAFHITFAIERKLAVEAVRVAEERYRSIFAQSADAIWLVDAQTGAIVEFNTKAHESLGYTREEFGKLAISDIEMLETADEVAAHIRKVIEEGSGVFETKHRARNGETRDILISVNAITIDGGKYMQSIQRDITDRKRAEEKLAAAGKELESIIEAQPDILYVINTKGELIKWNSALEKLCGLAPEMMMKRPAAEFVFEEDRPTVYNGIREVFEKGYSSIEVRFIRSDGTLVPHLCNGAVWKNHAGEMVGFIGVGKDMTEKNAVTAELTKAKEQAEAATKLKDQFVSLVAHDLKSPFAAMLGLIEHVANQDPSHLDDDDKIIMNAVLESGGRMTRMIDELLQISRLQTGKITPRPRFFRGRAAAAAVIESYARNASQKGIEIINEVPAEVTLYADQLLFNEVLLNLLSNAIKFCSKGDKVTIFTPPWLKSAIAVQDSGKGINVGIIHDIFRHEAQTSTPGTAGELGTGLGLPYSRDIMKAHGGELTVETAPGKGSLFIAALPFVKPLALVVDDEPASLMVVRSHLERIGIEVAQALGGEQALSNIKERRPHIIITDIMMPGMDGFELLDRVKHDSQTSGIPVIMMTTAEEEMREKAFAHGADDFVGKPIEAGDLIPRVRRFVG